MHKSRTSLEQRVKGLSDFFQDHPSVGRLIRLTNTRLRSHFGYTCPISHRVVVEPDRSPPKRLKVIVKASKGLSLEEVERRIQEFYNQYWAHVDPGPRSLVDIYVTVGGQVLNIEEKGK